MIVAIAERNEELIPPLESPVRWYQQTRGLTVDGVAGSETRHALIDEYMRPGGTTLRPDVRVVAHGCGDSFPGRPATDGSPATEERSIEAFLFENPIAPPDKPAGVLPEPPGELSQKGSKEYPEWVLRSRERHLHSTHWEPPRRALLVAWDAGYGGELPADVAFELFVDGSLVRSIAWRDAPADDGMRTFVYEPVMPTDESTLVAVTGDERIIMWQDQIVGPSEKAIAWEHTLEDLLIAPEPAEEPEGGTPMPPDWHETEDDDEVLS